MKKLLLSGLAASMLAFGSMAQSTTIRGLTVLVEHVGAPFPESTDSVALMLNQPDFNGWGNQGSVRDFYYTQSNGKVTLLSEVIKVSLPHPISYYRTGGGQDIPDIVNAINAKYPAGFQNLTLKSDGSLTYFTVLTKGGGGAWAFGGPTPHPTPIKNNGQNAYINAGNITNYDQGQKPEYNTICHELGHCVMQWPDYYQTAWSNLGNYCVMASAGNRKAPQWINPALRLQKGWITNVVEIGNVATDQLYTATANSYSTIYKYTNPNNAKEYLLVHPQVYGKYYQENLGNGSIADQGLAIYYVDEEGGMDLPGLETSYKIKLLQADNLDELHSEYLKNNDVRGDYNDLYNSSNAFPNSTPFRWKDGGEFGLNIGEISALGATVSFKVYARFNTHNVTTDKFGTVSPKGIIETANKTYTLLPNPGYQVYQVKINGVVVPVSGNTFTVNTPGNKNIHVTFARAPITPLPASWYQTEIGNNAPGFSAVSNGKFHIESYGADVWGNSDHFRFVYRSLYGDGSIVVKRGYMNSINHWSKAGIMIRESLQPNAAYSFLMYSPRNHSRVQQRASTGANAVDNPNGVNDLHWYELYPWMKITRVGNVITSSVSRDQITWVQLGQQTITMAPQVYIGLAVSGVTDNYYYTVAQFDNVTVTGPETNPNVTISTSAACGSSNQTIAVELAASKRVNATGYNWYYSGSGYNVTPVSGTPYKANFSTGNTFNGAQISVGVNYSVSPYYTTYTISLPKCVSGREDVADLVETESNARVANFPNPFTESTTLTLPLEGDVTVFSQNGNVVESFKASGSVNLGANYQAGVYFVKVKSMAGEETLKLVKIK